MRARRHGWILVASCVVAVAFVASDARADGDPSPSKPITEEQAQKLAEQIRRLEEQIEALKALIAPSVPTPPKPALVPPAPAVVAGSTVVAPPVSAFATPTAGLRPRSEAATPPASTIVFGAMTRPEGSRETRVVLGVPSLSTTGDGAGATHVSNPDAYDGRTYHELLRTLVPEEGAGTARAFARDLGAADRQIRLSAQARRRIALVSAAATVPSRARAMAVEGLAYGMAAADPGTSYLATGPKLDPRAWERKVSEPAVHRATSEFYAATLVEAYAAAVDDPDELALGGAAGHAARTVARERNAVLRARAAAYYERDNPGPRLLDGPALSEDSMSRLAEELDAAESPARKEEVFDAGYRTRLLAMDAHTLSGIHDTAAFDERPRFFAVTAGSLSARSDAMRTAAARETAAPDCKDGKTPSGDRCATGEWGTLLAGEGKFSFIASDASSDTLKEIQGARDHGLHKGFNVDSAAIDHEVLLGGFLGRLRGKYFEDTVHGENNFQLSNAYGELRDTGPDSDVLSRWVFRLGKSSIPIAMNYNDDAWKYWMWGDRPLVYTRLFHGDLESVGVSGLVRLVREPARNLYVRAGLFNGAETAMQGFIGGTGVGGYKSDGKGQYSFADLAYFGDLGGSVDLRPCACDPLVLFGGVYAIYGPNGVGGDGDTLVTGARARLLWLCGRTKKAGDREHDGFVIEGEWIRRRFSVDASGAPDPADLVDWGAWGSAAYSWRDAFVNASFLHGGAITFGVRYDVMSGHGASKDEARQDDTERTDRSRCSALLAIDPGDANDFFKHFTFSLEYRYDVAPYEFDPKSTVYLGFQVR